MIASERKVRDSGIELLRIIAMLFVVAAHYVSQSGVKELFDFAHPDMRMFFTQVFGLWGKTAINVFVLITGYFMCTGALTTRRFLKLYLQVEFYTVVVWVCMLVAGYEQFSIQNVFMLFAWPFWSANRYFTESFLWFYLFIPFYNVFIKSATRRQLFQLLLVSLLLMTVSSTLFLNKWIFHHILWYMVLYFVGAAIRLYPYKWMSENRKCLLLLLGSIGLTLTWVWLYDISFICIGRGVCADFLVLDSHKAMAFIIGVLTFLLFRNLRLGYHRLINGIASTVFGVLLIHTSCDGMIRWLWHDLIPVKSYYDTLPLFNYIGASIVSVMVVFCAGMIADGARILVLERSAFKFFTNRLHLK